MNPEMIIEGILKEISSALETMSKSNTIEEKVNCSKIVKNLSESFSMIVDVSMIFDDEDLEDLEDIEGF